MNTARELLILLSDAQCHSGESLGQTLGISRAAIWKQIHTLQSRGLQIVSIPGKGYQLAAPLELLEYKKIQSCLPPHINKAVTLHLFDEIDSTNQYLMNNLKNNSLDKDTTHVCLAETQTAGKGRRGRRWVTPYASSLAFSVLYPFNCGFTELSGLSLVVGVLIAQALKAMGANDIQLKWPNDILWQDQKLAGILIELSGEVEGPCSAVIGVGINISVSTAQMSEQMKAINQDWVDLNSIINKPVSRNQLSAKLIQSLDDGLTRFQAKGLTVFIKDWQDLDYLYNREVNIEDAQRRITGKACGISEKGDLVLATASGQVNISTGEVSVRAQS